MDTVLGTLLGAILIVGLSAIAVVAHLRRLEHRDPATPTPAGDDDALRLELHPDGTTRAVRIRGPHCRY